ncbi:MAG: polysaccharide pyruvyl transferase family protein [Pseudolabrys sp.]
MKSSARNGIFLSGYFGCGNLGDDLLLSAAVAGLRPLTHDAQFLIRDSGATAQLKNLGRDVIFTGIESILIDRRHSKLNRAVRYLARMASLLRRCRWLIFAGGTVFHEQGHARSLIIQWVICRLARLFRVRIAALGVGISDLHSGRGRWLLRDIVRISALFLVRDEAAQRQIAGTRARVTGDLVFDWHELLPLRDPRKMGSVAGPRTIALAVCPAGFQGASEQRAVAAFCKAARIWQMHGHRLVFLVFQKSGALPGDMTMFERIAAGLGQDKPIETRVLTASPRPLAAAYRDIDVLCGMRFHGFVLAALFGIPFVGVAHDNKISEICRRFDMTCLDASTFDGTVLAEVAEASLTRRPDPILVERSTAEAHENFRAFADIVT